jgi:hypothetical protein
MATRRGSHRDRATRVSSNFIVIDPVKWMAGSLRGTTRPPRAVRAPRAVGTASPGPPTVHEPAPPQGQLESAQAPPLAHTQPAPRRYAASNAPPPSSCPDRGQRSNPNRFAAQDPQSFRSDAAATDPTATAPACPPRANSPSTHQAQDDDGSTPTPCRHRSDHTPPAPACRAATPSPG